MGQLKYASRKILSVALLSATLFAIGTFGQGNFRFVRSNLTVNPSAINFGTLTVGAISSALTVTISNPSSTTLTITGVNLSIPQVTYSGPALPAKLAPGQSVQAVLVFIPSAAQTYRGSLQFAESNGRSVSASISGAGAVAQQQIAPLPSSSTSTSTSTSTTTSTSTPTSTATTTSTSASSPTTSSASGQLHLSSLTAAFNNTYVGNSLGQFVTVSNAGSASFTIVSVSLSGAGFSVTGISSGQILGPGQSVVLEIIFLPLSNGLLTGGVTINTDIAGSATIVCSGSAGSTSSIASTGSGSSTGSTASTTSTTTTSSTGSGSSTGATGSAASTGSVLTASSVVVTWNVSSSSSVIGYNIYRSTTSGAEPGTTPINGATPVTGNAYTDANIASTTTYYYAVTAVSSDDVQSADSNEATAATP